MTYIELLKDKPLYCVIVLISLLAGEFYYLLKIKSDEKFKIKALIFTLSGVFAILSSLAACSFLSLLYSDEKSGYKSVFSIFYALATFPWFALLLRYTAKETVSLDEYLNPLLISVTLSRVACMFEGCCSGTIGAAYLEAFLALSLLIYNIATKKLKLTVFYAIYFLWRFISEFFKDTYKIEKIGALSPLQYIALLIVALSIIKIIAPERRKK